MAEIQNLARLVAKLRAAAAKAISDSNVSVAVGYTQNYSIYVHENLQAKHPVGQAKFLEQPARTMQRELGEVVAQAAIRGQTLATGLLLAGLRLQRESQKLVPVDTGALKNSAFTELEQGVAA
jgi:hypothetical protein